MADKAEGALTSYVGLVGSMSETLYGFPKPLVAAIDGPSPAGGCMLALTADYRVMTANDKYVIGLNEVAVGIRAPWWLCDMMSDCVGRRQAERLLQLGLLVPASQAHTLGLVDELQASGSATLARAVEVASDFARRPARARSETKLYLRGDRLARMRTTSQSSAVEFATSIAHSETQATIRAYIARLRNK